MKQRLTQLESKNDFFSQYSNKKTSFSKANSKTSDNIKYKDKTISSVVYGDKSPAIFQASVNYLWDRSCLHLLTLRLQPSLAYTSAELTSIKKKHGAFLPSHANLNAVGWSRGPNIERSEVQASQWSRPSQESYSVVYLLLPSGKHNAGSSCCCCSPCLPLIAKSMEIKFINEQMKATLCWWWWWWW